MQKALTGAEDERPRAACPLSSKQAGAPGVKVTQGTPSKVDSQGVPLRGGAPLPRGGSSGGSRGG